MKKEVHENKLENPDLENKKCISHKNGRHSYRRIQVFDNSQKVYKSIWKCKCGKITE